MSVISQIGQLVDMCSGDFKDHCMNKDMGYIKGLESILSLTYNNLCGIKDDLSKQAQVKANQGLDDSQEISLINDVFAKLLNVEEKICVLREIRKEHTLDLRGAGKRTT